METFRTVVGHFGAHGVDHPDIDQWMDGTAWEEKMKQLVPLSENKLAKSSNIKVQEIMRNGIGGGGAEKKIIDELEREGALFSGTLTYTKDGEDASFQVQKDNPANCMFPPPVGVHRCKPPLNMHEFVPFMSGNVQDEISNVLERENSKHSSPSLDGQTTMDITIDDVASIVTSSTTTKNTSLLRP